MGWGGGVPAVTDGGLGSAELHTRVSCGLWLHTLSDAASLQHADVLFCAADTIKIDLRSWEIHTDAIHLTQRR